MITIRERAQKFLSPLPTHDTLELLVRFATAICVLQRQACAEAFKDRCEDYGDWEELTYDHILAAGTEPQNPFGCGCWRVTDDGQWWRNEPDGGATFLNDDAKYCDMCGKAKRREM